MFSPASNSRVHPEFMDEETPQQNYSNSRPFDLTDDDLYGDSEVNHPIEPTFTKRDALHKSVNKKLVVDRLAEGKYGGHVSRSRFTEATLEDAKKRGLKVDAEELVKLDALECMKQLEIVTAMPVNLEVKRRLRDKLYAQDPDFKESSCRAACYKCKLSGARRNRACRLCCLELDSSITLWRKTFKKIEGHYGAGVITYFTFLKWLVQLNLMIAFLVLLFIIIPEAALKPADFGNSTAGILAESCTDRYRLNKTTQWYEHLLDFIQGSGFMEQTVVFYGHYSATSLDGAISNYNLKLAYLLVVVVYFVISLLFMVHNTAKGFRARVFMSHNEFRQFSNKAFGGWDYGIDDEHNAELIHKSLFRELQNLMLDKSETERRENRSDKEICRIYTIRTVVFLIIFALLGGAGYLIFYVSDQQAKLINQASFEDHHLIVQFMIQYMTTVTIALLNALLPVVFKFIVQVEDYSPALEVNMTLARTVLLKLASLAVLVASLYSIIDCGDKDQCNVGEKSCTSVRCWETYVGQEFYKLVVLNLIIQFFLTFGYETIRRCIVTKIDNKLTRLVGQQEFDIPKNVLDLIYLQTLLWFGTMFCPIIPLLTVFSLYVIFYLKYYSCCWNFIPHKKPYRPSQSSEFFQASLLVCFVLCIMPLYYIVTRMDPSKSCGPYRLEERMYDVIPDMIDSFPGLIKGILTFITSAAFATAIFVCLVLAIYYMGQVIRTYKGMFFMMKQQLVHESNDKQFLLRKLAKLEGREFAHPPDMRHRHIQKHTEAETSVDQRSTHVDMGQLSSNGYSKSQPAPPGVPYEDI